MQATGLPARDIRAWRECRAIPLSLGEGAHWLGLTWHGDSAQGQLPHSFAKCPPRPPIPACTHTSHGPLVGLLSAALSAWGLLTDGSVPTRGLKPMLTQMNQTLSLPSSGQWARGLGTRSPTLRLSPRLPHIGKGEAW